MLTAAKSSLTILMKSRKQKHTLENIWWGNVNYNITSISPLNILWNLSHFQSYHQKYCRSRREFLEELLSVNGLSIDGFMLSLITVPTWATYSSRLGLLQVGLSWYACLWNVMPCAPGHVHFQGMHCYVIYPSCPQIGFWPPLDIPLINWVGLEMSCFSIYFYAAT